MSEYREVRTLAGAFAFTDSCGTALPLSASGEAPELPFSGNRLSFDITPQITPRNQTCKVTEVMELVGVKSLGIIQLQTDLKQLSRLRGCFAGLFQNFYDIDRFVTIRR